MATCFYFFLVVADLWNPTVDKLSVYLRGLP